MSVAEKFSIGSELVNKISRGIEDYGGNLTRRHKMSFPPEEYDALRKSFIGDEPFFERDKGSNNYFQFPQLEKPYPTFDIHNWRQDRYMASLPGGTDQTGQGQMSSTQADQGQPGGSGMGHNEELNN